MIARAERARLGAVAAAVVGLHVLGAALLLAFAPGHGALLAAGGLAYTLGVRHAFDPDHIAAIDNATRAMRASGRRSVSVGFSFSLGHSSVVLALTILVAVVTHRLPDLGGSAWVGPAAAGTFLWIIGILNLIVLADIVRVARDLRAGRADEARLQRALAGGGILTRLGLGRALRLVRHSWQMFPVGVLFGLGFETATEVALLGLGASAGAGGVPLPAILALPILFAAGMTVLDTVNGVVMAHAYDWGLQRPARRLLFNFCITLLSVALALSVGTMQLHDLGAV